MSLFIFRLDRLLFACVLRTLGRQSRPARERRYTTMLFVQSRSMGGTNLIRRFAPPSPKGKARASTKSILCHRKPASSLSMDASICCKMAFPGKNARKRSFYGRKLIAEANFICSSRRQSRRMRIRIERAAALSSYPGFFDSLSLPLWGRWPGGPDEVCTAHAAGLDEQHRRIPSLPGRPTLSAKRA